MMMWLLAFVFVSLVRAEADVTKLQIGVKQRPKECIQKVENGDTVFVHYKGMLTDGTEFDSSYGRGVPLDFKVGTGQVIEGWEVGVLGACVGEKRKLKIPPDMGYGETGAPPTIPGGATLIFEIEIMDIKSAT